MARCDDYETGANAVAALSWPAAPAVQAAVLIRSAAPSRRAGASPASINKTAELAGASAGSVKRIWAEASQAEAKQHGAFVEDALTEADALAAVGRDERQEGKGMKKLNQDDEPFFITEEIAVEMIAGGYEFELPPIPCTIRLRDVLERMTDAELRLQPGETSTTKSVNAAGASRVQPS